MIIVWCCYFWQRKCFKSEINLNTFTGDLYKERYDRIRKELAFTRKKMAQQHEEEMDQEHNAKKAVEKRVSSNISGKAE